ncbi:tyrosine-type recombinase/integrase [Thalassobius sp. I31.1]|uniref:tyrosine-type recombinase/integrase n=1 Tax=Thalassobius sp. I31.1 TaxID=2109912 RepID=UPI0013001A4F|nr:tyrosine-type recombinase/integrase [Thalassobius sp. I31.1]
MDAVSEGFTLYKRPPNGRYYARYSIKGQGQQRVSLGTSDPIEAERRAQSKWIKACALAEVGLSVNKKQFEKIAEEFITGIELAVQRGEKAEYHAKQYPTIIRRYFVEYFRHKLMSAIKADDIDAYWDWRKEFWITGPGSKNPMIQYDRVIKGVTTKIFRPVKEGYPSKSTLHKESLLLRQLFEFGQRRGYVTEVPEINVPKDKRRKDNSRPGFTMEEFMHLKSVSEQRVRAYEFTDADPSGKNQKTYQDRLRLHCFCMIAAFTGMRPTELLNLSWGDIEARKIQVENGEFCDVTVIQARGKGKERELAAMPETLTFFNLLKSLFYVANDQMPGDDDPVFFNHEGKRISSFKIGLAKLLIAADLRVARNGKLRDSFSFRHFYITQQIREGVGHHLLGRNVGTSSKMIDAYYSKIRPTDEIAQLIPDWNKQRLMQYRRK